MTRFIVAMALTISALTFAAPANAGDGHEGGYDTRYGVPNGGR